MTIDATLSSVTQFTFGEFMQNLANPTVIAKFRLPPLPGIGVLEFSPNIAFAIIERVFGGGNLPSTYPQRALTDIELQVMHTILDSMLSTLADAWKQVAEIHPEIDGEIETNPMFMQAAAPSEVMAVLTFDLSIGEHSGIFILGIPFSTVEPVLSKLSPHRWFAGGTEKQPDESERRAITKSVLDSLVTVMVELGRAQISVGQFMNLKVGDVLPVETRKTDPVPVYVGNRLVFHGRPGVSHGKMAVSIQRFSLQPK